MSRPEEYDAGQGLSDMARVIIPKSDQINADDLISGPMTVTFGAVHITAGQEQPVSIDIGIPGKVYRPCKSMSRVLVAAWGPDAKQYAGRSATLYRDPMVKWGGMDVGGIRISHLSDIPKEMTMALTATRATRKPYTVRPLAPTSSKTESPASDVPKSGAAAKWAQGWRERIADPDATPARLATAWDSPQNNSARDKARREDADLVTSVTDEVMEALKVLEGA